ncbi:TPA: oxidoreductase [Pseudomonas putida]|nr:oxidoreductase [Pseudomonas putida]HDS0936712.1 oxidoreductase [Pseudomonas putida]HDS1786523.1 oxidoreductase [Pseudomonas putida]HDS3799625.1 oxidoreductase [Pseudomonas putida]
MQHGLMSLAVLDPRFTNTMISVSVWVEGTAADVHGRLFEEANMKVTQASSLAQRTLVDVSVAAGTLESNARKVLQGMRITSQQAAQLVRTGFSGLRGVAGSWELLLAIGGLYLQHDTLSRNQEKAEAEIGPKAYEAKLALQGSQLGLLGGQLEVVGLVLRSTAGRMGGAWTTATVATGGALIRLGAVVSSVAEFIEAAQAISAAKRATAAGDSVAMAYFYFSAATFGTGAIFFAGAVFNSSLLGPLGIAVILVLLAYTASKQAERNESDLLARWARRCCFGKADETPVIHWDTPEYADIAFAELNAATLGMQAKLHFESNLITDPTVPRIGGLVGLEVEHKLKFQIVLPRYRKKDSAYSWNLIVHRHGDGDFPEFSGGEILVGEDRHASFNAASKLANYSEFSSPRLPDYKGDIAFDKKLHIAAAGDVELASLEISGVVELLPTIGSHSVVAATLLVMFWPDRNIDSAYAEVCNRRQND